MEKKQCIYKDKDGKICGKIIEGYSHKHVKFLMLQHSHVHRQKEKEEDNTKENETTDKGKAD